MSSRPWLPLLLVAALAACGREEPAAPAARIEGLQTFQVKTADAVGGRAWEGVVEAVQEATLSAQTNGRVVAVVRDVNDRVAAGDVLVRLSAVEQQSGVDAARAQLRAAEASATEAEANYRRFANLAKDQFVSRAQLDQARMARDSAAAARDAARAQLANAGQQTDYLRSTLKRYRDGPNTRANSIMTPNTKLLTDADIESLVAYVSSMQ